MYNCHNSNTRTIMEIATKVLNKLVFGALLHVNFAEKATVALVFGDKNFNSNFVKQGHNLTQCLTCCFFLPLT